jgi:hypothetical protein
MALSAYTPPGAASLFAAGGASDATTLSPYAASMPLRLTLLSSLFPIGPSLRVRGGRPCGEESIEVTGNIFHVQPYASIALTPRLVLHGFSDLGCAGDPYALLDAGAGGGFTYVVPLRSNVSLVPSAGAYAIPGNDGLPSRRATYAGLDVMKQAKQGRSWYTGLGAVSTGRGVRVMNRIGATF